MPLGIENSLLILYQDFTHGFFVLNCEVAEMPRFVVDYRDQVVNGNLAKRFVLYVVKFLRCATVPLGCQLGVLDLVSTMKLHRVGSVHVSGRIVYISIEAERFALLMAHLTERAHRIVMYLRSIHSPLQWTYVGDRMVMLIAALVVSSTTGCNVTESVAEAFGPRPAKSAGPLPHRSLAKVELQDLDGQSVDALDLCGAQAVVYVFTRTDCPIANRYAPELQRLQREYSPRGIAFKLVYADGDESAQTIARHCEQFGFQWPALRDVQQQLVSLTGASVTPEVAVLLPTGKVMYRGAIDDRHVGFGQARVEATQTYLANALEALLAGRSVDESQTKAVGCQIPRLP